MLTVLFRSDDDREMEMRFWVEKAETELVPTSG